MTNPRVLIHCFHATKPQQQLRLYKRPDAAAALWNFDSAAAAAKFIDRLPRDRYKEFLNLLCATEAWKK